MSFNKLAPVSLGLAVACYGVAKLYSRAINEYYKKCEFFVEAVESLKSHRGAIFFLGEPIECATPTLDNSLRSFNGFCDFKAKVKGPKSNGILYVTAIGDDFNSLKLDTVQLELENDKSKRLVIKDAEPRALRPK